jgi:hypothetical protein
MDKSIIFGGLALLVFGTLALFPRRVQATVTEETPMSETQGIKPIAPRGLRNNNPMNLRYVAAIDWVGQTGQDNAGYAIFDTAENGVRAGMINLRTGFERYNANTVRKIITRWAPAHENPTSSYIDYVGRTLSVGPDMALLFNREIIVPLSRSIVQFENGQQPYPDSLFEAAWLRAQR